MNTIHSTICPTTPAILEAPRCIWPAAATLGEGTLWSQREQALYWVDILERRLHRFDPASDGRSELELRRRDLRRRRTRAGARPDRHPAPRLRAVRPGHARTSRPSTCTSPNRSSPTNRFNDGKCDAQGRFWGGTMDFACEAPTGSLYRFDPDGRCTRHDQGFAVTNGPTWSLDGRTMYFNDTVTSRIYAYDFDAATGTLSNKRQWLRFARGDGFPDGMTTDAAGRLWIAHWGGACVTCHDPVERRRALPHPAADEPHHQLRLRRARPAHALHHQRHQRPHARAAQSRTRGRRALRRSARHPRPARALFGG